MYRDRHIVILLGIIDQIWVISKALPQPFSLIHVKPLEVLEHIKIYQILPLLLRDVDPLLALKLFADSFLKIFAGLDLNLRQLFLSIIQGILFV